MKDRASEDLAAGARRILGTSPLGLSVGGIIANPDLRGGRDEPEVVLELPAHANDGAEEDGATATAPAMPTTVKGVEAQLTAHREMCRLSREAARSTALRVARLLGGEEAIKEVRIVEYEIENFNSEVQRWLQYEEHRAELWETYQGLPNTGPESKEA